MLRGPRLFAAVAGIFLVGGLAACGGSSGAAGSIASARTAAPAVVPTTLPAATAGSVTGGGSGSGLPGAAGRCAAADLAVAFGPVNLGEGGQRERPIVLTNHSGRGCAVTGFPGVRLVARDGSRYFDLVRSSIVRPTRIVLAPGGTARATMRYLPVEPGAQGAYDVVRVDVTPPDATTSTSLPWDGGPVLDQSGATHPGTYIEAITAS